MTGTNAGSTAGTGPGTGTAAQASPGATAPRTAPSTGTAAADGPAGAAAAGTAPADPSGPAGCEGPAAGQEQDVSHLTEALRDVVDPELGINIVDLGLVYGLTLDPDGTAVVDMTLTSAACPLSDVLEQQIRAVFETLTTGIRINWVWIPPWGPQMITPEGREQMRALGFNV